MFCTHSATTIVLIRIQQQCPSYATAVKRTHTLTITVAVVLYCWLLYSCAYNKSTRPYTAAVYRTHGTTTTVPVVRYCWLLYLCAYNKSTRPYTAAVYRTHGTTTATTTTTTTCNNKNSNNTVLSVLVCELRLTYVSYSSVDYVYHTHSARKLPPIQGLPFMEPPPRISEP
jgi:hypothetical protein